MAAEIELFVDVIGKQLVKGLSNPGVFSLGDLFQGSVLKLKVWPVIPTYSAVPPYFSKADLTNLELKIALGTRAGTSTIYAYQYTWTKILDAGSNTGYFSAELDLNTTPMNSAVGSNNSVSAFVEVHLGEDGAYRIVYQGAVTVWAAVIDPTGEVDLPESVDQYLTRAECLEMFVRWVGNASGKQLELVSQDGSKHRLLGVSNDGEPIDYLI